METLPYIIGWLCCLFLLCTFQCLRTAFLFSTKYRNNKAPQGLTAKIVSAFYSKAGLMLTAIGVASALLLLYNVFFSFECFNRWSLSGSTRGDIALAGLSTLATCFLFGFLLPRRISGHRPDKTLKTLAIPWYLIYLVLRPITRLLLAVPKRVLHLFRIEMTDAALARMWGGKEWTDSRLRTSWPAEKPKLREKDMQIFRNALEFSNVRVHDCIVPRTEIIAVEISDSLEELMQTFTRSGKTKIIVYEEDLDHITGYVHSSEMFRPPARHDWTKSIRQIPLVPESMSAQKMMQIFMQQKKSVAVVVDEFGGTAGIISLEDLVEEIFGDIEDEHDVDTYTARKIKDGEYLLSARLEVEKVNEQFGIDLPESDEYLTVGGLILFYYQDFPKMEQSITIGSFNFTILKVSTSKIDLVRLKVNPPCKKK